MTKKTRSRSQFFFFFPFARIHGTLLSTDYGRRGGGERGDARLVNAPACGKNARDRPRRARGRSRAPLGRLFPIAENSSFRFFSLVPLLFGIFPLALPRRARARFVSKVKSIHEHGRGHIRRNRTPPRPARGLSHPPRGKRRTISCRYSVLPLSFADSLRRARSRCDEMPFLCRR